jgi:Zn-dependent M28 family amino/carboxypeptidase
MNNWLVDLMVASSRAEGMRHDVGSLDPSDASDHACFALMAIPAVLVMTRGPHPYYHTPADTIETIDRADLEVAALLMWSVLEPLALGTEGELLGE